MTFRKNVLQHQWREYEINLMENRLIFTNNPNPQDVQNNIDNQIDKDIKALRARLENTLDINERGEIQEEIDGLVQSKRDNILKALSRVDLPEGSPRMIYAGMTKTLADLEVRINDETDLNNRIALQKRRQECLESYNQMNKIIENENDLKDQLENIGRDDKKLARLESDNLDHIDLARILGSRMGDFLDDEARNEIEIAMERMKIQDTVYARSTNSNLSAAHDKAEQDWLQHKKETQESIKKLRLEKDNLTANQYADLMEQGIQDEVEDEWVENRILEILKEKSPLKKVVKDKAVEKAKSIIIEARELKINSVVKHLVQRINKLRKKAIAMGKKKPPLISHEQLYGDKKKKKEGMIAKFDKTMETLNQSGSAIRDQKSLKQMAQNLEQTELEIGAITAEVSKYGKNPEAYKKSIQDKYGRMNAMMEAFTKERIQLSLKKLEDQEKERIEKAKTDGTYRERWDGVFGQSPTYQKKRGALVAINNAFYGRKGKGKMGKEIADVEKQMRKLDGMKPEELIDIDKSLDAFLHQFGAFEGMMGDKINEAIDPSSADKATKANLAIDKLKGVTSLKEIEAILSNETFGMSDVVTIVDRNEFEHYKDPDDPDKSRTHNLNNYTKAGMVFYNRGGKSKIIINKDAFSGAGGGAKLNEAITHELHHYVFANNADLKNEWVKYYTESPEWKNIESTFKFAFPDKKPPRFHLGETEWKPEDIVNEIFGMQDTLQKKSPEEIPNIPFINFKKAVLKAGIPGIKLDNVEIFGAETDDADVQAIKDSADAEGPQAKDAEGSVGLGSSAEYAGKIQKASTKIKDLLKSEYISYLPNASSILNLMDNYNDNTKDLNEKYKENPNSSILNGAIQDRIKMVDDDLEELSAELSKASENVPNQHISVFKDLWNRTHVLSLDDIIQVGRTFKEWMERRHKRRVQDHAGRIGSAVFNKMPLLLSEFGQESDATVEKAEKEEVQEWQNRLDNKSAQELIELMRSMAEEVNPNKDELKAILRILADKGRIDWREPALWKILNKVQNVTHLSPNDELLLSNFAMLRQRLKAACGEIYDYDEFDSLERKNEGSLESKKKEYYESINKIQRTIHVRLKQLYDKWKSGDHQNVDPVEYEALLEYSIENGKCTEEYLMFFLLAGMAQGILNPDRGTVLDKLLNRYPGMEYIVEDYAPKSKKQAEDLCREKFEKDYESGKMGDDFKNFFWTEISNAEQVFERVKKSSTERDGWDHDWSRGIASLCDAETMKTYLQGNSGEITTKPTGVENTYIGMLQWFEENTKNAKGNWRKNFTRRLGGFFMAEAVSANVAYKKDVTYRRITFEGKARITGQTNHSDWNSVQQHRNVMSDFALSFNQPGSLGGLYELITNTGLANDPENLLRLIKEHLQGTPAQNIVTDLGQLDDFFNKLDLVISALVGTIKDSEFINNMEVFVNSKAQQPS